METTHKGFTITVKPEDGQFHIHVTQFDGSSMEHEDNPDFYETEEKAIKHGKSIIDEFLQGSKKYIISQQANGKMSIYTDTGLQSLVDETLIKWDIDTPEDAEVYVTNTLKGTFTY